MSTADIHEKHAELAGRVDRHRRHFWYAIAAIVPALVAGGVLLHHLMALKTLVL